MDDKHFVKRLHRVARHDWKHSHPLDLTDEGLMADLEKRGGKGADKLALNIGKGKQKEERLSLSVERDSNGLSLPRLVLYLLCSCSMLVWICATLAADTLKLAGQKK